MATIRLALTQSFRFGPAVATEANKFLAFLESGLRLEGFEKIASTVGPIDEPDAILCRTNAGVIANAIEMLAKGKKVAICGGTGDILKFAKAALQLQSGKLTTHPDLVAFKNWQEVCEFAESDEGADIKVLVKLINEHGVQAIIDVCDASVREDDADVVVSTAHKAKGREWDTVKIGGDFRIPDYEAGETLSRPEAMLMYVSVTRAKKALDAGALSGALPA